MRRRKACITRATWLLKFQSGQNLMAVRSLYQCWIHSLQAECRQQVTFMLRIPHLYRILHQVDVCIGANSIRLFQVSWYKCHSFLIHLCKKEISSTILISHRHLLQYVLVVCSWVESSGSGGFRKLQHMLVNQCTNYPHHEATKFCWIICNFNPTVHWRHWKMWQGCCDHMSLKNNWVEVLGRAHIIFDFICTHTHTHTTHAHSHVHTHTRITPRSFWPSSSDCILCSTCPFSSHQQIVLSIRKGWNILESVLQNILLFLLTLHLDT